MKSVRTNGIKPTLEKRQLDLEKRVDAIEKRLRSAMFEENTDTGEADLLMRHGEYVDKATAAKILGVTRATVYAMLKDGRIEGAWSGSRVTVRSIAAYMRATGKQDERKRVDADEG